MPRSAAKFLGPLAGLLVLILAYLSTRGILRYEGDFMGSSLGVNLFRIAEFLLVGRVLLSWLPPGPQGGHGPRDLPLTLAVSYLLGTTVLAIHDALISSLLGAGPPPQGLWGPAWMIANRYGPWLVLAVVRLATRPAAMVPRHEVPGEPPGPFSRALTLLAIAWSVLLIGSIPERATECLRWIALWIVVGHGLGQARLVSGGVAAVTVLGLLHTTGGSVEPALYAYGTGAAFLIGWLRRADRRALWLASIGFASAAVGGAPTLVLAGLITLVLSSHEGQRKPALTAALTCTALVALPGFLGMRAHTWFEGYAVYIPPRADLLELLRTAFDFEESGPIWFLFTATLAVAVVMRVRQGGISREKLALMLLAVLAPLALLPLPWSWTNRNEGTILMAVLPVAMLLIGLVWIPEEEPD